jgi:hypothetical protein
MNALFSAGMDRTEMVSGKYPSSAYVTVNPSLRGTDSAHGVRQTPPFEAWASAPGGLEWIITVAVEGGSSRSKLGRLEVTAEQLASARPHAAAAIVRVAQPNAIDRYRVFRILPFATGLAMNGTNALVAMGKKPQPRIGGRLRAPYHVATR